METKYCSFEDFLKELDPQLQSICDQLRNIIKTLDPNYVEIIWKKQSIASYGVGPKKMSEHYVYIAPQKKHVNLGFYHGTSLSNQSGLLEGTGKRLRHIKISQEIEAKDEKIQDLISEAIKEIKSSLKLRK
jgi:hypothetical protein